MILNNDLSNLFGRIAGIVTVVALLPCCFSAKAGLETVKKELPTTTRFPRYLQEDPADVPPLPSCVDQARPSVKFGLGPNYPDGIPGVGGRPRFGIPEGGSLNKLSVRRPWHKLNPEEKERVVRGFVLLQQTTANSGLPGAEAVNYASFCAGQYDLNLYDYYNELHFSCFGSWGTKLQDYTQRCHQGPHFLPWHRYLLLRLEADMKIVLNDPDFAMPYWDWDICMDDVQNCPELFDEYWGGPGSCDAEQSFVENGLLYDLGFRVHLEASLAGIDTSYNDLAIACTDRPIRRQAGCGPPPISSKETLEAAFARDVYDVPPYESCFVSEDESFRMYIDGFSKPDDPFAPMTLENIDSIIAGNYSGHGAGHFYFGGDLGLAAVAEPLFFLHHSNVDRVWAMWQDNNIAKGNSTPRWMLFCQCSHVLLSSFLCVPIGISIAYAADSVD